MNLSKLAIENQSAVGTVNIVAADFNPPKNVTIFY
jgi:hypothetical protein